MGEIWQSDILLWICHLMSLVLSKLGASQGPVFPTGLICGEWVVSLVELAVRKCCLMQGQNNTCPVQCFQECVESLCLVKTSCVLPWLKKTYSESRCFHKFAILWQLLKLQPWISLPDLSNSVWHNGGVLLHFNIWGPDLLCTEQTVVYAVPEVFTSSEQHVVFSLKSSNSPLSHDAGIKYCNANLVPFLPVWLTSPT